MTRDAGQAWMQMWAPAPRFASDAQETQFLAEFSGQFAMHRRWALLLGFVVTLLFIGWDFGYAAGDPAFAVNLVAVVLNRCLTAVAILPFLWLAWTDRFEHDEHFATIALVAGLFVNFLFYCRGYPLIHNSHLIGDCGYRYPGFDCEEGGAALRHAFAAHDADLPAYRARAQRFLATLDPEAEENVRLYTEAIEQLYAA